MADNGSAQSASSQAWPLPSFYFTVEGFKTDSNFVAIEALVLAHEGVNVK